MQRIFLLSAWMFMTLSVLGRAQTPAQFAQDRSVIMNGGSYVPVRLGLPSAAEPESVYGVPRPRPVPPPPSAPLVPTVPAVPAATSDPPPPPVFAPETPVPQITTVAPSPGGYAPMMPPDSYAGRRRVVSSWRTSPLPSARSMSPRSFASRSQPPAEFYDAPAGSFDAPAMRSDSMWVGAEYVLWQLHGNTLPPLVTGSPFGTPLANAGVLGAPGTTVLIGNEDVNDDWISGGMLRAGFWLDAEHTWGIQGDLLYVGRQESLLSAGSNGSAIVSRPFVDAASGAAAAQLVSFPGIVAGTTTVASETDPLVGGGILLRRVLARSPRNECEMEMEASGTFDVSLLAGYRYLQMSEDLVIQENLVALDPLDVGTSLIVTDRFGTRNQFHGADLGLHADYRRDRWSLDLTGRVAIGSTQRRVAISGNTAVTVPGFATLVNEGGLYALSSNSGVYGDTTFAFVPQLDVTAGYQFTSRLRGTAGYSALWWTQVARPGDQIDPVVNPNLLPPVLPGGPSRPAFLLHDGTLWVHGLRFGLEFRF